MKPLNTIAAPPPTRLNSATNRPMKASGTTSANRYQKTLLTNSSKTWNITTKKPTSVTVAILGDRKNAPPICTNASR